MLSTVVNFGNLTSLMKIINSLGWYQLIFVGNVLARFPTLSKRKEFKNFVLQTE